MNLGDDIKNKAQELGGKAKEFVGDKTDNQDLQAEGAKDRTESGVNQAREKADDAIDGAGAKLSGGVEGLKDGFSDKK